MEVCNRIRAKLFSYRDKFIGNIRQLQIKHKKLQYGLYSGNQRKEKYVISMASFSGRYNVLPAALKSLIFQDVKADKIIVWLDEESEENKLTADLEELKSYGIEFRHTYDGLKPHKKYFYAMIEFPDANIITVDDDVIYSGDLLKGLIAWHEKYPQCICARRVHRMRFEENGKLKPYVQWDHEYRGGDAPSSLLCATGCGGTLYPPHIMPKETFDIRRIKELSLEADDIWLKMMELLKGIKVIWVKNMYVMPLEINNSQKAALNFENVRKGKNDVFIDRIISGYPQIKDILGGVSGIEKHN